MNKGIKGTMVQPELESIFHLLTSYISFRTLGFLFPSIVDSMGFSSLIIVIPLVLTGAVALRRETAYETHLQPTMTVTASPPPITEAPNLRCSSGSTVLFTTDCTLGTPVSYCHKPRPPIRCKPGFFPSVWHPDHCMEQSTCFPLNAAWITTECSNGAVPLTTSTLFDGTLADGSSTVVSCKSNLPQNDNDLSLIPSLAVSCSCPSDQWYSVTMLDGNTELDTFCMTNLPARPA